MQDEDERRHADQYKDQVSGFLGWFRRRNIYLLAKYFTSGN